MPLVAVELAIAQDDSDGVRIARAFQQTLQESGWTPGQNIRIEYRWGATSAERAQVYAEELLKLNPDVIVAHATIVARAVSQQTNKIPTVFTNVSDPLGERFVKSFAQPGGEMTGFLRLGEQDIFSAIPVRRGTACPPMTAGHGVEVDKEKLRRTAERL